jgi:acyl-[acyl-carrier-protein]-phospholipid O-acyltransferase/long-chain-fatty-acid--[acyl-carrier-protein] ligase
LKEIPIDQRDTSQQPRLPLRGLLIAQFCGAFNDNAWKFMVALLGIHSVAVTLPPGQDLETASQNQTALALIIFTLPLVLTSLVAGYFADRISKRTIIITMKGVEVLLMTGATLALLSNPTGGLWAFVILAGMGVHSAIFSPAKYGILPELLPHEQLARGNSVLELWTFLAILTGTTAGGFLLAGAGDNPWIAPFALTMLALIGLTAAWAVPPVPRARATGGLFDTLRGAVSALRADRLLRLAITGAVFFWTIASLVVQNVLVYAKAVLGLSDALATVPSALISVGIGLGAIAVGRLSRSRVEYGLVPLGAAGVAMFLLILGWSVPQFAGTLILMIALGVSSALIFIPINALVQWRAPHDRRGSVIALENTCVFTGILLGSLSGGLMANAGLSTVGIFLATALVTTLGTIWAMWLMPETFIRLLLVLLTNTLYKLRIVGHEHVPVTGGALLVPNHISFIDGLLLIASLDRPIRFVVDAEYVDHPLFKPFLKALHVIPISSHGGLRVILRALREAGRALDSGDIVCIFPEGQITRTGNLLPFRRGFERILKGRDVPVLPVHLDRVWGSIFSFVGGRFLTKWPERIPYPVTVSFGTPVPAGTAANEIRALVRELGEAAWRLRKPDRRPLHHAFIKAMRRHPFRLVMADATRPRISCLQALIGAIVLARALKTHWHEQQNVGLLVPPTVAGGLTNVAAMLAGRTSVNLNYTVGKAGLESAVRQANIRTIVTSRKFVEKAKLDLPDGPTILWLEDIAATIGRTQKAMAAALALLVPLRVLESACGQRQRVTMNDVATIIFSSGSTGEPKGVMLTHFNIDANVQAVSQVLPLDERDRILGILPLFHSFGHLVFWFVTLNGAAIIFHPSPLDVVAIGELCAKHRLTFLVCTPTFLQLYQRRCSPEQFSSLRVVLTGAEKLSSRVSQSFEDRFGLRPIEGYGVTECAPVIAVNCPDFRASGFYQPASRRGTVGQPLPGVSVRIVDPDSFAPLAIGKPGMLLVKGPNVMKGYLGREDLTVEVLQEGWYNTGDIATLDDDGFLTITDRLSRFSKIGGEMVPHRQVEEALHTAAGEDNQVFAVTGLPDERKGEQLAVLHTLDEDLIPKIQAKAAASGLPNLFLPARSRFIKVEALPLLGTGKLDLRALKRIAMERLEEREE